MVFGQTPAPLAPTTTPLPDVQVPPAPASSPSTGFPGTVKNIASGEQKTGTDYNFGAAPTGSTADQHDDPLTRDRAAQKDADAAAAARAGVSWPKPQF
jgi:hypothetical protein